MMADEGAKGVSVHLLRSHYMEVKRMTKEPQGIGSANWETSAV